MSLLVPHNKLVLQAESCLISRPQIHCLSTRCRDLTASRITEWLSPRSGRQLFWIILGMWSRAYQSWYDMWEGAFWSIIHPVVVWCITLGRQWINTPIWPSTKATRLTWNQHLYLTIYGKATSWTSWSLPRLPPNHTWLSGSTVPLQVVFQTLRLWQCSVCSPPTHHKTQSEVKKYRLLLTFHTTQGDVHLLLYFHSIQFLLYIIYAWLVNKLLSL